MVIGMMESAVLRIGADFTETVGMRGCNVVSVKSSVYTGECTRKLEERRSRRQMTRVVNETISIEVRTFEGITSIAGNRSIASKSVASRDPKT